MTKNDDIMNKMKEIGGHYAVTSRYCHPSLTSLVIAKKRERGVFDLEKTIEMMEGALAYIKEIGKKRKVILFVSSRQETLDLIEKTAIDLSLPYMVNRWIGGTLSNFKNIRSRVDRLEKLRKERDDGKWAKYTKKEKVLLNRELGKLESKFIGIKDMDVLPAAIFILDTKKEKIAVNEAHTANVPVIGFSNADADVNTIQYPIIANIYTRGAVEYILGLVADAYKQGVKEGASGEKKEHAEK